MPKQHSEQQWKIAMTKQHSEKTKQLIPTRQWINERTDADRTATNKTKQQKDKQLTPTRRWINERTDTDNTAIRWNDKTARWQTTDTDKYLTQTKESVKMIQSTGITHKQLWQKKKKWKAKTTGQQLTKWMEWREKTATQLKQIQPEGAMHWPVPCPRLSGHCGSLAGFQWRPSAPLPSCPGHHSVIDQRNTLPHFPLNIHRQGSRHLYTWDSGLVFSSLFHWEKNLPEIFLFSFSFPDLYYDHVLYSAFTFLSKLTGF